MISSNKTIAIVGGGPGGLTLARLLQLKGAMVKVYERDMGKDARVQGSNLDLHEESGLAALKKADLLDAFYANYLPDAGKSRVMGSNGEIHLDDHSDEYLSGSRPEIDRGPLRKILLDSLRNDTVVWDSQFVSMKREREGWELYFKNGRRVYADIVIGADGANSRVRPYLSPIKAIYSGVTIVEGNIYEAEKRTPHIYGLLKGGKIFALGNSQSIIISAKGGGSISFYLGEKVDENWVRESGINFQDIREVKNWFNDRFSKWDSLWGELFESENMSVVPRPLYHYPATQFWETQPNLTIIGDAAHVMPPYAGEGVNMAMLDALELSEALFNGESESLRSAFANFEAQMFERMKGALEITMRNTAELHAPQALELLLDMFNGFKPKMAD